MSDPKQELVEWLAEAQESWEIVSLEIGPIRKITSDETQWSEMLKSIGEQKSG